MAPEGRLGRSKIVATRSQIGTGKRPTSRAGPHLVPIPAQSARKWRRQPARTWRQQAPIGFSRCVSVFPSRFRATPTTISRRGHKLTPRTAPPAHSPAPPWPHPATGRPQSVTIAANRAPKVPSSVECGAIRHSRATCRSRSRPDHRGCPDAAYVSYQGELHLFKTQALLATYGYTPAARLCLYRAPSTSPSTSPS